MGKVRKNCSNCGKFVWRYWSELRVWSGKCYCCKQCFRINRRTEVRVELECVVCNNTFKVAESKTQYESSKYCSKKCAHKKGYYSPNEKIYPNTSYLRQLVFQKQQIENLSDSYVGQLIKNRSGVNIKDIPQELIELKRLNIKRKRLIKNHNQKS